LTIEVADDLVTIKVGYDRPVPDRGTNAAYQRSARAIAVFGNGRVTEGQSETRIELERWVQDQMGGARSREAQ
jgi:hypothetical protein